MKRKWLIIISLIIFYCVFFAALPAFADEHIEEPKVLASIGDSITEAIDAEVFGANHWASWVNGYHGFWQWLFGLTNVNSHNQRISSICGQQDRKNYMEAESGADSFDIRDQVLRALSHSELPTYVTMFMGQNDICQENFANITPLSVFKTNIVRGLKKLRAGLPAGSTILVVGIIDIPRLYDVAQDKLALGIVDCEVLWFYTLFDLFPCGTVLSPLLEQGDRDQISKLIKRYNYNLKKIVARFQAADDLHNYTYTDAAFDFIFDERHVSDLDCFHPSAYGQKELSELTWDAVVNDFENVCDKK